MVTTAETVDGYTAVFVFADSRVWAKKIREVELGPESWTSFASVVTQQQCYGHCPCDSAPHSS